MELYVEHAKKILDLRLPRWDKIKKDGIYSDQLIHSVNLLLEPICLDNKKILTKTMVNNYVKLKLMPPPEKKKYYTIHIAYSILISILKPVINISNIKKGIDLQILLTGAENSYDTFCHEFEESIKIVFSSLKIDGYKFDKTDISNDFNSLGMKSSCLALSYKLLTEIILLNGGIGYTKKQEEI